MTAINLTINGSKIQAETGETVLHAARNAGFFIPTFCHDPRLTGTGACRICVVEVTGIRALVASCVTPAAEGMIIETESQRVLEARKANLSLLLANHPQDCLTCDRTGMCKLQDYAYRYGVAESVFSGEMRDCPVETGNPFFERDMNKCILCGKCIQVCWEINGACAIDFAYRGFNTAVTPAFNDQMEHSPCTFCGMCVDRCPVGALIPVNSKGKGRSWNMNPVKTICPYCGTGCSLYLNVRDDTIVGVLPDYDGPANKGELCVKGRFGWDFVHSPERLTNPLVRQGDELVETTWDKALDLVASKLKEVRHEHGPGALAGLSSARCTNEENYLFQKFIRALGTNNVDHCARLCHAPTVAGLREAFGSGAMTNSIGDIQQADCLFIIGSNTPETHPVIGYRIWKAVNQGTSLIVADPRRTGLAEKAHVYLPLRPGTDVALLNSILHVLIKENLVDHQFIEERTEDFELLKKQVEQYAPEVMQEVTGVSPGMIKEAALLLGRAARTSILYTMGVTQHTSGTQNVLAIANLAMATGNIGLPGAGVNPLRGQNNVQGACDMGALPVFLPGYQVGSNLEVRDKFEQSWGFSIDTDPGLTVTEIFDAALQKEIKAMYIMGENPMLSDADIQHVEAALKALDFLVVQDIFLTETAKMAHVVLPAASFAEKDGTFTNTERRVQRIRQAVSCRGNSLPDWKIISELARRMGFSWSYTSPKEIMDEIATVVPTYGGINYARLEEKGLQWPCPSLSHPGTAILHENAFVRGWGKFHPVAHTPPHEQPDERYPMLLTTGRMLYHYHTGTMTRNSPGLNVFRPQDALQLNPQDAQNLGLGNGETASIESRRGSIKAPVEVSETVPPGVVFLTFHFSETPVNVLTGCNLDPIAKIPELKVTAVRVEKANANA